MLHYQRSGFDDKHLFVENGGPGEKHANSIVFVSSEGCVMPLINSTSSTSRLELLDLSGRKVSIGSERAGRPCQKPLQYHREQNATPGDPEFEIDTSS
jgi:hypothetical protein